MATFTEGQRVAVQCHNGHTGEDLDVESFGVVVCVKTAGSVEIHFDDDTYAVIEASNVRIVDHKVRWFVRVGDEWIPRTSSMRGLWFYDAKCSCGWESRTGGATERSVREAIAVHRREIAIDWTIRGPKSFEESNVGRALIEMAKDGE